MQTRMKNVARVVAAGALVAVVGGQALAANVVAPSTSQASNNRPRIKIPKPMPKPNPDPHNGEYDQADLWAKTVVTTFANFNEPNAKLIYNAEIMNVGTQDFQGSRIVWLVATPKGGNPVTLAKKTLTSLKKGKTFSFSVDQPKWVNADTKLSLSIDPGDFNPGNDTWDISKEPPVKQPG